MASFCPKTAVMRHSHGFSAAAWLTSTNSCFLVFVKLLKLDFPSCCGNKTGQGWLNTIRYNKYWLSLQLVRHLSVYSKNNNKKKLSWESTSSLMWRKHTESKVSEFLSHVACFTSQANIPRYYVLCDYPISDAFSLGPFWSHRERSRWPVSETSAGVAVLIHTSPQMCV